MSFVFSLLLIYILPHSLLKEKCAEGRGERRVGEKEERRVGEEK